MQRCRRENKIRFTLLQNHAIFFISRGRLFYGPVKVPLCFSFISLYYFYASKVVRFLTIWHFTIWNSIFLKEKIIFKYFFFSITSLISKRRRPFLKSSKSLKKTYIYFNILFARCYDNTIYDKLTDNSDNIVWLSHTMLSYESKSMCLKRSVVGIVSDSCARVLGLILTPVWLSYRWVFQISNWFKKELNTAWCEPKICRSRSCYSSPF